MQDLNNQSHEPFVAILRESLGVLMHHTMRNMFVFARENNLSMPQMGALTNLFRQDVRGVSNIGDELGVTSAAASQMLERLVQQGLIERQEDLHDRRVKKIIMTDKGRRMIHEGFRARQKWLDDLALLFTPAEREQIGAALSILVEKARQLEGTAQECETDDIDS
ncbi:MAG: MarR family transcriptional regulator [Anaerolineae bacterium]|nr:MarR family transcriptional regulator [Anaerolineae bacterium]